MKPKKYVIKYNLNINDNFNHNQFVEDLTIDFISLLEVGKATENIKGYDNAVRAIKMKFDAINNKTVGIIPNSLWNYFYATVIVKMRNELFPEVMAERKQQYEDRKRIRDNYRRFEEYENNMFRESFFNAIRDRLFAAMLFMKEQIPIKSFEILGLNKNNNVDDINKSYRSLSMIYHPDKGGSNSKFTEITEAKNKCLAYIKSKS